MVSPVVTGLIAIVMPSSTWKRPDSDFHAALALASLEKAPSWIVPPPPAGAAGGALGTTVAGGAA